MKILAVYLVICVLGKKEKQPKRWDLSRVKTRALRRISKNLNEKCDAYSMNESLKCVDQLEYELRSCLVRCDEGQKALERLMSKNQSQIIICNKSQIDISRYSMPEKLSRRV